VILPSPLIRFDIQFNEYQIDEYRITNICPVTVLLFACNASEFSLRSLLERAGARTIQVLVRRGRPQFNDNIFKTINIDPLSDLSHVPSEDSEILPAAASVDGRSRGSSSRGP
jgi:hypothetical protein